jgi:DNA replication protein DnaC
VEEILSKIVDDTSKASTETSSNAESEWRSALQGEGAQKPPCEICGGLGFVTLEVPVGHPQFGRAVPCKCKQEELEARRIANLRSVGQLEALKEQTFESFIPDGIGLTGQERLSLRRGYERCLAFSQEPKGWCLIHGGYGCGKTHLAAAIANYQLDRSRPVVFTTVPDLLDFLRATFAPSSAVGFDERFQQIKSTPLLILDDFGAESSTPWAQEKLFQILNYRYNGRLPTVITTNYELEDIEARMRSRLVDPGLVQIVTILAPDFRHTGVDQEQSKISSLNLHFDQTFGSFDLREGELPRAERENLQRAFELARTYAHGPENWLVLTGAYGCGKTHLAAAIANHWRQQGFPVLFVGVPDLLDDLRATFSPSSSTSYGKRFRDVRAARYLVLDDLGVESATNWAREKLYQIFDYRYNARLPTVITTATEIEKLDNRLASRMLDPAHSTIFAIMATSYRGGPPSGRQPGPARKRKPRSSLD